MSNSATQAGRMLTALHRAGYGTDVSIRELYAAVIGPDYLLVPHRYAQQRIGAVVSKINQRADGTRIVPGAAKRTYRIERL